MMHRLLFNCAIRWELVDRNPVDLVRQSSKRTQSPPCPDAGRIQEALGRNCRSHTGRWFLLPDAWGCESVRFWASGGVISIGKTLPCPVQRSVVGGKVYDTKTEASSKPMPIDPELAKHFCSSGGRPCTLRPPITSLPGTAANRAGRGSCSLTTSSPRRCEPAIGKVGWHTFRHTFSSILHNAGTNMAVQKELLRHADISTTMNMYTQAASPAKREAVHQVARVLLNGERS